VTWHREYTAQGGLIHVLRERAGLLAICRIVRRRRDTWEMHTLDEMFVLHGSLADVKTKALGMLGIE